MKKKHSTETAPRTKRFKIEWNKVTWYSKLIAVVVFVVTFCAGVWLGMYYQYAVDQYSAAFEKLPDIGTAGGIAPQRCGGFIRNAPGCPADYHCVLGRVPDMGGLCVHD